MAHHLAVTHGVPGVGPLPEQFSANHLGPVNTQLRAQPPVQQPARIKPPPAVVEINIGGTIFSSRRATMLQDNQSLLAALFGGQPFSSSSAGVEFDPHGRLFIDRSPTYFHHVLEYLRNGKLPPESEAQFVYEEAKYYHVSGLLDWCSRQSAVINYRVERQLRDAIEEEYEQFKQAILQASQQHFTSAVQSDFSETRLSVSVEGGSRNLRTLLFLILAPSPSQNVCKKIGPNSSPGQSSAGGLSSKPLIDSARFVVGEPQLARHRFASISSQWYASVDIALPFMPNKKLDLLYCFVSHHLASCGMRLHLRQGTSVAAAKSHSHMSVNDIPCWDCGELFPLYELQVTWGTSAQPAHPLH